MKKRIYYYLNVILSILFITSAVALLFNAKPNYGVINSYGAIEVSADEPKAELPSALTLVGTKYMPPIDSQGQIGCCASESATYRQLTNAVGRYIEANYPDMEWGNPSLGDKKYIFSPKFTYTLGGSFAYEILLDHGTITIDKTNFYKNSSNASYYSVDGVLKTESVKWDLMGDNGLDAMQFRLKNYEKVNLLDAPYVSTETPKVNDEINVMFTTSEAGQALIYKIKDALNRGNVVTTSGYADKWKYGTVTDGGAYGNVGEDAYCAAVKLNEGAHMVSIVGYDDNIKAEYKGVTLQGAFLVANSWGEWYANNGYVWVMYDALNTVSEHPELNINRSWFFYEFNFTYWDKDIAVFEMPERILKTDITVANREAPYIVLTMTDNETGNTIEHVPAVFYWGVDCVQHPNYDEYGEGYKFDWDDDNSHYLTFNGIENGAAEKETFYFSYQSLIDAIPEGKTLADYTFGARFAASRGATVKYSDISLIDGSKVVLQSKTGEITCISTGIKDKVFGGNVVFNDIRRINVTAENGEGYFFNYNSSAIYGERYEFTLTTAYGYSDENALITVNGERILPTNGKYVIEKLTEDITIRATGITETFTNGATVNFYVDGDIYASYTYKLGEEIVLPPVPEKDGYTFVGWSADVNEQEFYCIPEPSFPETMPGYSFNAYAKFALEKTTVQLSGGRYGTGMENFNGTTVLLFTIDYGADKGICSDLWDNRYKYEWTLHYSWRANSKYYTFEQNIVPSSNYDFDTYMLFRFEICENNNPFVPKQNMNYSVSLSIDTIYTDYEVSGYSSGYCITTEPICHNENAQVITVSHYFKNNNDFQYWSDKNYMTLKFSGIDASVYNGNYFWRLYVTDKNENRTEYTCYPNSFYQFSETEGLVRFSVLEFGWVPETNGEYAIDFEVYDDNELLYIASISDVKCKLTSNILWKINGRNIYENCNFGEIPIFDQNTSYETSGGRYDHIAWMSEVTPAIKPSYVYVSLGKFTPFDCVVTFKVGGVNGAVIKDVNCATGFPVAQIADPEKEGYTFGGWYKNARCTTPFDFNGAITGDTTIYAKFVPNSYTVTFVPNGGTVVLAQNVKYDENVTEPDNPVKTGYAFTGWYKDVNCTILYDFDTAVTGDLTLYAGYNINTYTVTFNTKGGTAIDAQSIDYGGSVTKPANPTRTGYTFSGWFKDYNCTAPYDFDMAVTENLTIYAKFMYEEYYVSFMSGNVELYYQVVTYGDLATVPAVTEKTGYTFNGWYENPNFDKLYNFNMPIIEDLTLYARYTINIYTITFVSNGGTAVTAQNVDYGGLAVSPDNPEKTGYTFNGWYKDIGLAVPFNFNNTVITENTVLFAKYVKNSYTLQFNTDDGSVVSNQTVEYGDKAEKPDSPTKKGYTFETWYVDLGYSEVFSFETSITGNTTVYAKFIKNTYTVTFVSDGKTVDMQSVEYQQKATKPDNPEKIGYTFDGWYETENYEQAYDFATAIEANTVIYAKFTEYVMQFSGFIWDGHSAQAKYTCADDEKYVEYYAAVVTSEIREATCEEAGLTTYTATYDGHSETREEAIAKKAHKASEWITDKQATTTEEGHRYKKCSECGEVLEEESIPKLEVSSEGCSGEMKGSSIAIYSVMIICAMIFLRKFRRNKKS